MEIPNTEKDSVLETPALAIYKEHNDLLKPLQSFREVCFQHPWRVFSLNKTCFIVIALVAAGLRFGLAFLWDLCNGNDYSADYGTEPDVNGQYDIDYNYNYQPTAKDTVMWANNMLIMFLVMCWADGATARAVGTMYAGSSTTTPWTAMVSATKNIIPLVGTCFTISFFLMVAYVCTILLFLGIENALDGGHAALPVMLFLFAGTATLISLVTYLIYPIIMVEQVGVQDSIQRSLKLMNGNFVTVFLVLLVYGLLKSALSILVILSTINVAYWTRASLSFLINATFLGIFSIVKAVLYFHILVKDEQLDRERLQQDMGISSHSNYTEMTETTDIGGSQVQNRIV